jgi:glycosyltransferase involved in cell wall biosynthesis
MKIVIISPFQFRLQRGIERFSHSLANAMADLGHQVIIYSRSKDGATWGDVRAGVSHRVAPRLKYYEEYGTALLFRIWLMKDNPNSIIINFLYHGESWLPKSFSYTYVLNSPASQIPGRYNFINEILPRFKKIQFVAVSEMVKREALPFIHGNPICVIPNGVDTAYFKPIIRDSTKKAISISTLAALEERKGMQFVINALARFGTALDMPFEYHIFGDGPYLKELQDLIRRVKLEHLIFIHSSTANAREALQRSDVFILPSKGEAFALAPIEAMACGLPIITSNFEPYTEFVNESFGKMVNRENGMEIINAINYINSNYSEMSNEARKASVDYDWSEIARNYLKVLN